MKRNYEMPELQVQKFAVEDIIVASVGGGQTGEVGGGGNED